MAGLNFLATLEEVIEASDEVLKRDIGSLSPEVVIAYVFHLRNTTRSESHQLKAENDQLKIKIQSLQNELSNSILKPGMPSSSHQQDYGAPIVCSPCPGSSAPHYVEPTPSVDTVKFCVSSSSTKSNWAWDVVLITVSDLTTGAILPVCDFFDSGSVYYDDPERFGGYHIKHAFNPHTKSWWGGRKDEKTDTFYLGGTFTCRPGSHLHILVEQNRPEEDHPHKVYPGKTANVHLKVMDPSTGLWKLAGKLEFIGKKDLKLSHEFHI